MIFYTLRLALCGFYVGYMGTKNILKATALGTKGGVVI